MPLVITLFVPEAATAQNKPSSGDQHTARHAFASAAVLAVHDVPFVEVITAFVPELATATNNANSGDQHTEYH